MVPDVAVSSVTLDQDFGTAVWELLEARQGSIVVIDRDGRPVGRLFATDVVANLQRHRGLPWRRSR
jgi:CBS-domain-containing membrane protein